MIENTIQLKFAAKAAPTKQQETSVCSVTFVATEQTHKQRNKS